jgi:hypothetical protein
VVFPNSASSGNQQSSTVASFSKQPHSSIPVQRISPEQMRERRQKGLCYYCDEKWNPAHHCKNPKIYMMQGLELQEEESNDEVFYESNSGEELLCLPDKNSFWNLKSL